MNFRIIYRKEYFFIIQLKNLLHLGAFPQFILLTKILLFIHCFHYFDVKFKYAHHKHQ